MTRALILLIALAGKPALAAQFDLYFHDHQVNAKIVRVHGALYAEALPLAQALGLAITRHDDTLWIGKPPAKSDDKFLVNGRKPSEAYYEKGTGWYVDLNYLVSAAGDKLLINPDTRIIDILPAGSSLNGQTVAELKEKALSEPVRQPAAPAADWLTYENKEHGLVMQYPKNWEKMEGFGELLAAFRAPSSSTQFRPNVNIIAQDLPTRPMSLDAYGEASLARMKEKLKGLHLEDSGTASISNNPADKFIYSWEPRPGEKLEVMQEWTILGQTAYVFTYTAEPGQFDAYLNAVTNMFLSARIEGNPREHAP